MFARFLFDTRAKQLHRCHPFAPTTKLPVTRPLHHGSLASRAPVVPLPRYRGGGKVRSSSRHHRKPGNDDAELHCRDATSIRVFCHACQESLPRTDGRRCLCSPKMSLLPKEGGGAPNGAPIPVAAPRCGRRSRGPISGTARLSALLRGHAPGTRLGLGRASWNHRMQTGGPSPAPVQRAPRSPARAGRADTQTA